MQVHIPWSSFKCQNHYHPGFYADVQSHCSIWHYCQPDGRQDSFKCVKGTLFNQKSLTCDWWFNVDCPNSPYYYDNNRELYKLYGHPHHGEVKMKKEQMILRSALPSPSSKKKTKRPKIVILTNNDHVQYGSNDLMLETAGGALKRAHANIQFHIFHHNKTLKKNQYLSPEIHLFSFPKRRKFLSI
uniref:Chitin-binding type-2 domain-containing protein n=1 Tax=Strigamia maritima TaxID=126957 RepID=T1JCB7_STRMM